MALINKLNAIGDAIREKTGKTELLTLDEMPVEIKSIQGGGEGLERGEVNNTSYYQGCLTDDDYSYATYSWTGNAAKNFYPFFINTLKYMDLKVAGLKYIAYEATKLADHLKGMKIEVGGYNSSYAFYKCSNLTHLPEITGSLSNLFGYFCYNCYRLKDASGLKNATVSSTSGSAGSDTIGKQSFFYNCYSLRNIPSEFLTIAGRYPKAEYSSGSSSSKAGQWFSANTFYNCYSLDEVVNFGVSRHGATGSSNNFGGIVSYCGRLKRFTFETNEDGTPITVGVADTDYNLSVYGATLDFSNNVGYLSTSGATQIQNYAGFTEETRVIDDATYQALKDNPDYWTTDINYSRYNHDSAVETINSLFSLTESTMANYSNTIKFKGASGALTDGGAINTLTEEEIAVAAAKGWTVTLA